MVCRSPPKFRYLTRATVSCRGMAGRPRGTSPARRALVNRTAFGVSAFGFDPWRERPLRGRVAVQRRRPRRAPPDAMVTGHGGENATLAMAPEGRLERHHSCISGSDGRAHAVERGAARRRSDWSRCLRLRWRSGASFIGVAIPSTVRSRGFGHALSTIAARVAGGFRAVATPSQAVVRCGKLGGGGRQWRSFAGCSSRQSPSLHVSHRVNPAPVRSTRRPGKFPLPRKVLR